MLYYKVVIETFLLHFLASVLKYVLHHLVCCLMVRGHAWQDSFNWQHLITTEATISKFYVQVTSENIFTLCMKKQVASKR